MTKQNVFVGTLALVASAAILVGGVVACVSMIEAVRHHAFIDIDDHGPIEVIDRLTFSPGPRRQYVVHVAHWGNDRVAFIGELSDGGVARKCPTYKAELQRYFGEDLEVYELYPSLQWFIVMRCIGGVICFVLAAGFFAASHDLLFISAIQSGQARPWLL